MKNCPVCQSSEIKKKSYPYSYPENNINFQTIIVKKYQLFSCNNCGSWFKDHVFTSQELEEHYKNLDISNDQWAYTELYPHELKIEKHINSLEKGSKILDVGCWTGRLMSCFLENYDVYGVEPNEKASKIAQDKGVKILGDFANEITLSNQLFDCIVMVDVYEHLENPVEIIETLLKHLKKGGKLLIITGRTNCFPVDLVGSTYWYFSLIPDHIVFLNQKVGHWLQKRFQNCQIRLKPVRHYNFNFRKFLFETIWLISWRFMNPNSPFKKLPYYKIPFLRRLKNLKDIIICTSWKDHYYLEITKNEEVK